MSTDLYLHTNPPYGPADIVLHTSAAIAAVEAPVLGGPVWAPARRRAPRPQQPDRPRRRRIRMAYGPATITGRDVLPVHYSARIGNPHVTASAVRAAQYHQTGGPAQIRHEDRENLTVRASSPDDLEILLLLLAAL